jgi:DNA-binding CsgD family transcriptional regulator
MTWRKAAASLAEIWRGPLAVLDARGRIELANRAMQRVLGQPERKLLARVGVECGEKVGGGGSSEELRRLLRAARSGAAQRHQTRIDGPGGDAARVSFTFAPTGNARRGVIVRMTSAEPADAAYGEGGLDYEVSFVPEEWILAGVAGPASEPLVPMLGQRCYRALYGRDSSCPFCPVGAARSSGAPAASVLRPRLPGGDFRIVTASLDEPARAHLHVLEVDSTTVSDLIGAKIDVLADAAALSDRERGVLQLLLVGRSLQDIADALGISRRTVKFHQFNLLAKLGAESRTDLVRLIL